MAGYGWGEEAPLSWDEYPREQIASAVTMTSEALEVLRHVGHRLTWEEARLLEEAASELYVWARRVQFRDAQRRKKEEG